MHIGIFAAIFSENFGKNIEAGRLIGADHQSATRRVTVIGDRHKRLVAQFFHPYCVVVKNLARRGQLNAFAGTIEQPVAILLLQLADLRADRGLRPEDFFSGTREAALAGNFQESYELIKIHGGSRRRL